jgi:hypothetical protein
MCMEGRRRAKRLLMPNAFLEDSDEEIAAPVEQIRQQKSVSQNFLICLSCYVVRQGLGAESQRIRSEKVYLVNFVWMFDFCDVDIFRLMLWSAS